MGVARSEGSDNEDNAIEEDVKPKLTELSNLGTEPSRKVYTPWILIMLELTSKVRFLGVVHGGPGQILPDIRTFSG
jgi:hypothetical protein